MLQPWLHFLFFILLAGLCSSQSIDLQNIETFYPVFISPTPPSPIPDSPISTPPALSPSPPAATTQSTRSVVGKTVAATAASTLVFAAIFFFAVQRYCLYRRLKQRQVVKPNPYADPPMVLPAKFARVDRNVKGLIVDENGLDVLYWRKLEEKSGFVKEVLPEKQSHATELDQDDLEKNRGRSRKREPIQEVPLLRENSSASYDFNRVHPEIQDKHQIFLAGESPPAPARPETMELKAVGKHDSPLAVASPPLPLPPIRKSSAVPPPPPPASVSKIGPAPPPPPAIYNGSKPPPPPPASANRKGPAPPPPPPTANVSKPPPLPPASANKMGPAPPPPPPVAKGSKPPPGPPKGTKKNTEEEANGQVKLKPLHWEKVNANTEHSMVWNKLDKGSFRFDGDLMEALFGTVAANRSPTNKPESAATSSSQMVILDPRKSQNIAIVLKSLGISRQTLLLALQEGHGLEIETIEKLARIAPTKEEETKILSFAGDPARLADAESFLYHLLKQVPSAFNRLELMHFRSLYASEIDQLKDSLQTLESGCNELRTRGLFMKLLEAILKAGNRMNAGTARGNAQAFNLTALRKLSDVKSTDGKTTLLHFVVEEVVRAEGKRGTINRNGSLSRNNSVNSSDKSKEEREKQYTILGLPVVGGLSSEFTNVKKSAGIDFDTFSGTWSNLSTQVSESQRLVAHCEADGGGFVREMRVFLGNAEEEVEVVGAEQRRVMEIVKKTTEYYQAGASKDRAAAPLQLFVIVKDFLAMVDQVCVQIARNSQKKKANPSANAPSATRSSAKFPILPKHFMSDKSSASSTQSDSE